MSLNVRVGLDRSGPDGYRLTGIRVAAGRAKGQAVGDHLGKLAEHVAELCAWFRLRHLLATAAAPAAGLSAGLSADEAAQAARAAAYVLKHLPCKASGTLMGFTAGLFPPAVVAALDADPARPLSPAQRKHPLKLLFAKPKHAATLNLCDAHLSPRSIAVAFTADGGPAGTDDEVADLRRYLAWRGATPPAVPPAGGDELRDFDNFAHAWPAVLRELSDRLARNRTLDLQVLSVSGRNSWADVIDKLPGEVGRAAADGGAEPSVTVAMLLVDDRVLRAAYDHGGWDQPVLANEVVTAVTRYREFLANRAAVPHAAAIAVSLATHDAVPQTYGILIDNAALFAGTAAWAAHQTLTTSENPYRLIRRTDGPAADEAVTQFQRWFLAYQRRAKPVAPVAKRRRG